MFLVSRIKSVIRRLAKKTFRKFQHTVPIHVPILQCDWLRGRAALITGGTSGIGFAIAEAFLRSGASVVITGRNEERLNAARERLSKISGNAHVFGIVMDNADVASIEAGFKKALTLPLPSQLDILVNNAGIGLGSFGSTSESDYDAVLDTNLKGAYFLFQEFAKRAKQNRSRGNILNVCSSSSLRPANSPYVLSKWGLRALTLGLAKMLLPYGVVVNGIAPGPTATPMLIKDSTETGIDLSANPSGRYATAAEIANLATILVSDFGRMIVGDIIYVGGGAGTITLDDMNYVF